MKKILIVLLALVLILALGVGCGKDDGAGSGSSGADAGSGADMGSGASADTGSGASADTGSSAAVAEPVAWPSGFPAGFPEYTDGTVISVEEYEGGASARISGTNDSAIAAYIGALEAADWTVSNTEGNAEGTTLIQEIDEDSYRIVYLGYINDGTGDFVVSLNERTYVVE